MSDKKDEKESKSVTKGFKLMGKDMLGYNKFQYKIGETHRLPEWAKPVMCEQGFHFCEEAKDCLLYVSHLLNQRPLRLFHIEAQEVANKNDDDDDDDGYKKVAKTITIKEEIKDLSFLSGKITHSDGSVGNYVDFALHGENDEPALVSKDGSIKEWHVDGKLERGDDKPAYISSSDAEYRWYKNGKLHRDGDKPAIMVYSRGDYREWFVNGGNKRQNLDDPTCVRNGVMYWHDSNGRLHRDDDKPAVIYPDGREKYYTHGLKYYIRGMLYI